MAKKGINSTHSIYYGRRKGFKRRLTIFLLVLLLILMALAAGFFYLQEFIVYTSDGFRFDFPFLQPSSRQPEEEPAPPEEIPLILEKRNRNAAGPTAPAHGLTMMGIEFLKRNKR